MANSNFPGQTLGIIGHRKIAARLVAAAKERGYKVVVYSDHKNSDPAKRADWAMFSGEDDLMDLAGKSDLLLFESVFMNTDSLHPLEAYIEIPQLSETLSVTQDRLIEKVFLETQNINVLPYATITAVEDLEEAINSIGFPCVLKPIRVEENQYNNIFLYSAEDFAKTQPLLRTGTCILEAWVPFDKELAISFVSGKNGQLVHFPVVETFYHHNNLAGVAVPAQLDQEMEDAIEHVGHMVTSAMGTIGIVTIEFFVTAVGAIYVKRVTTGPQEVLDYSLDGTNISQYEAFIRAVCGLPIPKIVVPEKMVTYFFTPGKTREILLHLPKQPDWYLHMDDDGGIVNAVGQTWDEITELLKGE